MTILITLLILSTVVLYLYNPKEFGSKEYIFNKDKILSSSNFKNGRFENYNGVPNFDESMNLKDTLNYFFNSKHLMPKKKLPVNKLEKDFFETKKFSDVRLTWFGHSTLLLEMANKKILLDPMLSNIASPVPLAFLGRYNPELPIKAKDLPFIDLVLVSHDHYDHLDYKTIKMIKDKVGKFYVPLGIGSHLVSWGVNPEKIKEFDWWEEALFDNIEVAFTPSHHFSGRRNMDMNTLWGSWVIKGKDKKIYFSGDSGYTEDFKKIGEKYGPFDLSLIECGQYNEKWADVHLMPEEVVKVAKELDTKILMPIHWSSFRLAYHHWAEPVERVLAESIKENQEIITPMIGEEIILDKKLPNSKWWKGI